MSDKNDSGRMGDGGPATVIELTPGQIVSAAIFMLVVAIAIFLAGMFARGLTTTAANPAPEPSSTLEEEAGTNIPAPAPPTQTARASEEPEPETPPPPATETEPESQPEKSPPPVDTQPRAEIIKPEEDPAEMDQPPETAPAPTEPRRTEIDVTPVEKPMPEPQSEPEPESTEPEPESTEPEPEATEPEPMPEPEPEFIEPEPETAPPPAQPTPQPLPELPASTDGQFTVQVMSIDVAKRARAEAFQRDALEDKAVQVRLVDSSDGRWVRAFVGRYSNRAEADRAMEELRKAGFDDCFVKRLEE